MTMWEPGGVTVAIAMTIAALTAYLGGRVHGRSRQNPARRLAYRDGYDRASVSLLAMTAGGRYRTGGEGQRPPHDPFSLN